jgi:hypothetical protein
VNRRVDAIVVLFALFPGSLLRNPGRSSSGRGMGFFCSKGLLENLSQIS